MRVHSECLTGDVFGSLRCDCGDQLPTAMAIVGARGRAWSSTCARKAAASAWSTSSRPTRCRTRARHGRGQPGARVSGRPARLRHRRADPRATWASATIRLMTNNPKKIVGLRATASRSSSACRSRSRRTRRNVRYLRDQARQDGAPARASKELCCRRRRRRSLRRVVRPHGRKDAEAEMQDLRRTARRQGAEVRHRRLPLQRLHHRTGCSRARWTACAATASPTATSTSPGCRAPSRCRWSPRGWRRAAQYDAVICLGAVIRGATPHFDYVAGEAAKGIAQVSLETGVPVIFGVLTTDTIEQAIERAGTKAGNKGWSAAADRHRDGQPDEAPPSRRAARAGDARGNAPATEGSRGRENGEGTVPRAPW